VSPPPAEAGGLHTEDSTMIFEEPMFESEKELEDVIVAAICRIF
jgi:hypothetical protein